jgi:hypothetical protein
VSVARVSNPGPCWLVEIGEYEFHAPSHERAVTTAVQVMGDALEARPYIHRSTAWCWVVVCPGCGVPLDDDEEFGDGLHYDFADAQHLDAEIEGATQTTGTVCSSCADAQLYGSVAAVNGAIIPALPGRPAPAPVLPGDGQLSLLDDKGEVPGR